MPTCHGELETCIMTQHLIAAEVHGITALGMPAMSKAIVGVGKELSHCDGAWQRL